MSDSQSVTSILAHFEDLRATFEDFGNFLHREIEAGLRSKQISFFKTEMRVKDSHSLEQKVKRYRIERIDELGDFLGLRVICYYERDIEAICALLRSTFLVSDDEDKRRQEHPEQFGYRSYHITVSLPREAVSLPLLSRFDGLCAEIQVRTIQMHSWAALSHAWSYKSSVEVPKDVLHEIAMLSTILEQADRQIELVADKRREHFASLRNGGFVSDGPMNLDTLEQALMIFFPHRDAKRDDARRLLTDMLESQVDLKDLDYIYRRAGNRIDEIEQDIQPRQCFSQAGAFRILLDVSNDWPERWEKRKDFLSRIPETSQKVEIIVKWRQLLQSTK